MNHAKYTEKNAKYILEECTILSFWFFCNTPNDEQLLHKNHCIKNLDIQKGFWLRPVLAFDVCPKICIQLGYRRLVWCIKIDGCEKSFAVKSSLQRHVRIVHDNLKSFICQPCDLRFSTQAQLNGHTARIHFKICHPCTECQKSYSDKSNLKRHVGNKHENWIKIIDLSTWTSFFCHSSVTSLRRSDFSW